MSAVQAASRHRGLSAATWLHAPDRMHLLQGMNNRQLNDKWKNCVKMYKEGRHMASNGFEMTPELRGIMARILNINRTDLPEADPQERS